jgi:hypothetical protein
MDFQFGDAANGRSLKFQNVIDERSPLPGHPGVQALQGESRDHYASGSGHRLPSANVHPVRQRAGIHPPAPTGLG